MNDKDCKVIALIIGGPLDGKIMCTPFDGEIMIKELVPQPIIPGIKPLVVPLNVFYYRKRLEILKMLDIPYDIYCIEHMSDEECYHRLLMYLDGNIKHEWADYLSDK